MLIRTMTTGMAMILSCLLLAQSANLAAIAKKDGKYGMIDPKGNWVIAAIFDGIQEFDESGKALAKKGELWGLINKKGEWVLEPKYNRLREFEDGYAMAEIDGHWVVIDEKGGVVFDNSEYKRIDWLHSGILIGYAKKEMVYIDMRTGNKLNTPATKKLFPFSEGLARFNNGQWGYIDISGAFKIQAQFDDAEDFKDGKAKVKKAGLWGMIDKNGNWLIPAEFDDINSFKNGNAIARKGDKYGIIDENGKWILEPNYEKLTLFESGLALATKDAKQGYVKEDGSWMDLPSGVIKAYPFSDGYAMIKKESGVGYMNTSGEEVVKAQYTKAHDWYGPFGRVLKVDQWCFVDAGGKEHPISNGQKLYAFHSDLACFKADDKYGYVDKNGSVVIKAIYDNVEDEFLHNVTSGMGIGLLKKSSYEEPNRDRCGFIIVRVGDKFGTIDKTGKVIIPIELEDLKVFYPF